MSRAKLIAILIAVAAPVWVVGQQSNFMGGTPASVDATKVRTTRLKFPKGSRSNWHTHPTGQHLLVTHGVGRTQEWGGPIVEIRAGDHIWCPPGVKHWHGASPTTAMTHIALTGTRDGQNAQWMEKVTDEQYGK